jgi:hypothetical protein
MLATLAFVERFPDIIATIAHVKPASMMVPIQTRAENPLYKAVNGAEILSKEKKTYLEWDEPSSPPLKRVEVGAKPTRPMNLLGWSPRGTNIYKEHKRSSW